MTQLILIKFFRNQQIEEFDGYYYPRYIPDNYEIIVKNNMDIMGTIIYSDKLKGTSITYEFSSIDSPQQLDTENCIKEEILINNQLGLLYIKKDKIYNMIIFQDEEYKFVSPQFIALKSHIINLKIEDNSAICTGSAICLDDYTVKITLYLQRYINNNWTSINNWSGDKDIYSYVNETYTVSSGYRYRVKSIATVYDKNNNVVEAPVLYTDVVEN